MTTRIGKIAQLPKSIRDDLNQRLENGKQGPELLQWLNALPETQKLLAEKFEAMPINRQNLTEWRQGGYQDWLRHQQREQRVQRIVEEGGSLGHLEGSSDLFENCARIAIAEWLADMDTLHEFHGEERSKRLRALNIDLARLQNAWNHSSWASLAWVKWNERFLGPDDYTHNQEQTPTPFPKPSTPPKPQFLKVKTPPKPQHSKQIKAHQPGWTPPSEMSSILPNPWNQSASIFAAPSIATKVAATSAASVIPTPPPIPTPKP